jgi:hypothetical protein
MRALGPGSVSSLLKIALDVAFWALCAFVVVIVLVGLGVLVAALGGFGSPDLVFETDEAEVIPIFGYVVVLGIASFAAYLGGFAFILHRLRKLFRSLVMGDPFRPENTGLLRQMAWALAGVTAVQYLGHRIGHTVLPDSIPSPGLGDLMTPIFSVLVVFVLAEVFREGARLRREQELTI